MTPLEQLTERDNLRKMKLKDYRYHIKGTDTDKPFKQCMEAILIGFIMPLVLAIVIRTFNYLITGS